ncbi:MAG: putative manganese-dependent inorganic diphosphatase [Chthoniobacteraceae bacterium]|jgi:manganese-dependent inorganic pyrophosphatase
MQTIVIGHRNPDMDSICSAIGYARLKQLMGNPNVIAARAGDTNERIDYVLAKFGVEAPVFIPDLSPRVCDVMERNVVSVRRDSSAYDAIHLIEKERLRGLPVIDEQNRCMGLLSAYRVCQRLFPAREDASNARLIEAPLPSMVETFGGRVVAGELDYSGQRHLLVVAAMRADSLSVRLGNYAPGEVILFVGDREDAQRLAIEARVKAIVVTGGLEVSKEILAEAEEAGVTVISSDYDTATTVLLARGAVRVDTLISSELFTFTPDTLLEEARKKATSSRHFVFPIVDENGALVGILSKSDFLKPIPRELILVDHNELSQAVHGAEKVRIVEILDHHRIGGLTSDSPILFWNNPVGSTSTLVALSYRQAAIPVPKPIAGLLLAGVISDTLNLTSPTATVTDREIVEHLCKVAGVDAKELAAEIFAVGSPLLTMTPEQTIQADSKEYQHERGRFVVAQIEELSFSHLAEKQAGLLQALASRVSGQGLLFMALLVTDINTQNSRLLACGAEGFLTEIDFPQRAPNVWELQGVVSRKKQLLPYLLRCVDRMR